MARGRALLPPEAVHGLARGRHHTALGRDSEVSGLGSRIHSQCTHGRCVDSIRLVDGLGLHSTLSQYKVLQEDVRTIAVRAVGTEDPLLPKVVGLLQGIYA